MVCDRLECKINIYDRVKSEVKINRNHLKDAEVTQIDSTGQIINEPKIRSYGNNIKLKIIKSDTADLSTKYITLSPYDIGRRYARSSIISIKRYIERKSHRVIVNTGKSVTLIGVLCLVLGLFSICLVLTFGVWKEKRKLKKAS